MNLPSRWLAREGIPVAAILLFWNVLAVVAEFQGVGGPVRNAGTVMAGLYVVVRGVALSSVVRPPATGDPMAVLRENARLAVPAGAWFVAAMAVLVADGATYAYGPSSTASALAGSLAGGGLGVVGLYAVAAGYSALGDGAGGASGATGGDRPADRPDDGPADDDRPTDGASADD